MHLLWSHIKGKSIRTMAQEQEKSLGAIQNQLKRELSVIPENDLVTVKYCNRNRWCGVLLVDAKYIKVKGYKKKIAFIYGIDYLTHDIPVCLLAPTENYQSYKQFFVTLKNSNYRLRGIVSDEHESVLPACHYIFGDKILRQLCHVHFAEKIRRNLRVRTDDTYKEFMNELANIIFKNKRRSKYKKSVKKDLHQLAFKYMGDQIALDVLVNISEKIDELTNFIKIGQCPTTNNLIESSNKQLEGRMKTIQNFESFRSAKRWLNAWLLCRRVTKFYDCNPKFKNLNGKRSIDMSKKAGLTIPDFFPKF